MKSEYFLIFLSFLCFTLFYCVVSSTSECIHSTIDNCKKDINENDTCKCPCVPKCCPKGQILSQGPFHGVQCVTPKYSTVPLPEISLDGDLEYEDPSNVRFYESVFPSCLGINDSWNYDIHNNFSLNADFEEEYLLHILSQVKNQNGDHEIINTKIISHVHHNGGDYFVQMHEKVLGYPRYKPLTYFCFDVMDNSNNDNNLETVALTCPRKRVDVGIEIFKCCPMGETFNNASLKGCKQRQQNHTWMIPINGHLFNERELHSSQNLFYNESKSLLVKTTIEECLSKEGYHAVDYETDTFHIGPDGKVHFRDSHDKIVPSGDFCVEDLLTGDDEDGDYTYENFEEENSDIIPEESSTVMAIEGTVSTCHKDSKPRHVVAVFCTDKIIHIPKCCNINENLNLRGRSCTRHKAAAWITPPLYNESFNIVNITRTSPLTMMIYNMEHQALYVSNEDFYLFTDGKLHYRGKNYSNGWFCLDYSIDYCSGTPMAHLRAIINDPDLESDGVSTIFGTNKDDSHGSKLLKQIGYPISIFALLATLVIFFLLEDLRKELHGKMVICIVGCLLVVYLCLFIKTFDQRPSKTEPACVIQASVTYYFILCTFAWMSAMSYNIMTKFRGTSILPKTLEQRRFQVYSVVCFGFPGLMLIVVVCIDRFVSFDDDQTEKSKYADSGSFWRPGFGEESCWFNSCSNALSIFLYGPVSLVLFANLTMFMFSAVKLYLMHHRLHKQEGGGSGLTIRRRESITSRTSSHSSSGQSVKEYVRQMSNVSNVTTGIKRLTNNKERLITYLKLFVAMGLTWMFEVLVWFTSTNNSPAPKPLILAVNLLNVLQGIVIFFVFAVKRNTKEKLRISLIRRGVSFGDRNSSDDVSRIRRMTSRGQTDSLPAEFRRKKKLAKLRIKSSSTDYSPASPSSDSTDGGTSPSILCRNDVTSDPAGFRFNTGPPSPT